MAQPHITPAHKITNMINKLGKAQSCAGAVMRYGAQAGDPEESHDKRTNVQRLIEAMQQVKLAIQMVEEDIMQSTQRAVERKLQERVEKAIPDEGAANGLVVDSTKDCDSCG